ncbi:response regulator [Ketobacter sp. MCCC 1A13808]|uniref:response regulator n=1 Tax=Ketobacter sp. MCCC 1A13808 TaxID=2602738 RepID=UPI000F1D55A3|nr:response regulator [Ketobacter sp. MCCC 1A13808]MVF10671.1 response regulator [Ketobacter sp. MCCC 1A13808]RLP56091.1 MAG: response regulator [Ketobacter sp.]
MKRFFDRLSIAGKLVSINMVVVFAALLCALAILVVSQRNDDREQIVSGLRKQTEIMALSLAPALQREDQVEAARLLSAYQSDPAVKEAVLFGPGREVFARYSTSNTHLEDSDYSYLYGGRLQWPGSDKHSVVFSRKGVLVIQSIPLSAERQGGLFVRLSLQNASSAQSNSSWFVALVFLFALSVAWLMVRRMVSVVTEPIDNLLEAIHAVRDQGNYAVRVEKIPGDELGELSHTFNQMLKEIGERDAELSKQHLKLEVDVQDRTRELRTANESLEQTVRALQQANRAIRISEENKRLAEASASSKAHFLANMSHELRTPMNGVLGMLSLLNETELSEEQKEYLGVAYESGHVLLDLINNVLDLSKIEQGKLVLESIRFDLRQSIEEVFAILAESAQSNGLELALDWEPGTPLNVVGDPIRFKQLIVNLVGNSIKFTSRGHIRVGISQTGDFGERKKFRFTVCDTGIGIKEEVRDLIFEKFSQADTSTTREFGGTGLGLALCKQLTRLMDGTIGVESEYGKGSTFWFEVFFTLAEVGQPDQNRLPETKHFLILEPDRAMQSSFATYLATLNITARSVADLESLVVELEDSPAEYNGVIMSLSAGVEMVAATLSCSLLLNRFSHRQIAIAGTAQQRGQLTAEERIQHSFIMKPLRYKRLKDTLFEVNSDCVMSKIDPAVKPVNLLPFGSYKLLVVEDNAVNQQVARGRLEKLGYSVQVAENGAAALEMLNGEQFDLIFMDCQMPVLDGYQATRRIRQEEKRLSTRARTPIIAMTAHALAGDRDQCIKAGMDDYVAKPFRTEELKQILERWLRS